MATKLQKEIRREIEIDGEPFTVTISPTGVKLTRKRFRSGREMTWRALWQSGEEGNPGERPVGVAGSND